MKIVVNLPTGNVVELPVTAADRAREAIDAAKGRAKSDAFMAAMELRARRKAALDEIADERIKART